MTEFQTLNIRQELCWLSDRMPDSKLRTPEFESPLQMFQNAILFCTMPPQFTQQYINEYLATDSGGHVSG